MAKKKRNKLKDQRHNRVAALDALSPDELLARGNLLLEQEKFQDAVACFKQLLKQKPDEAALRALEQAYIGRIRSLAEKSMIKEAMALLDTLVQRCPKAEVDDLRLGLLIRAGDYAEAARLYSRCHEQLPPDRRQWIEALLGALLIADAGVKLQDIAGDSPVARFYPQAMAALELFFTQQNDTLQEALRSIPVRSPYRDLRTLLSGLLHFERDREKGGELLRKISEDSPYYHTVAGYLAATDSPKDLLTALAGIPKEERPFLRERHGLPIGPFRALEDLARTDITPPQLYRIVRKYEGCFKKTQLVELLRNILPFCGLQTPDILDRSCSELSLAEKHRLCGLAAEQDGAQLEAIPCWDEYLSTLNSKDTMQCREIAMVIRHQADLMRKDPFEYTPEEIVDTMLKSLKYDPDHAQTWLDASNYAERHLGLARHYAIIQEAVEKLPDNVSILLAAMKASGNRNAHKKAAGLAGRVLALDPINTTALDFMVESRLEHGRRLASQKKWALAEKELLDADTRVKSVRLKGRQLICLGMLRLLQENETGLEHIIAGQKENPFSLLGHVLVSLEARLYSLPAGRIKEFDRNLQQFVAETHAVDKSQFLRLFSWLSSFTGKHWLSLKEICQGMKKYFSKAATLTWQPEEGLLLCKTLERIDLPMALVKCSGALMNQYPEVLEFEVWNLLAGCWKKNRPMSVADTGRLNDLMNGFFAKRQLAFVEHIVDVLKRRRLRSYSPYHTPLIDEEEDDFGIDFGPFGPPKHMPRDKPQPAKKPASPPGRQLNLFDDDL